MKDERYFDQLNSVQFILIHYNDYDSYLTSAIPRALHQSRLPSWCRRFVSLAVSPTLKVARADIYASDGDDNDPDEDYYAKTPVAYAATSHICDEIHK